MLRRFLLIIVTSFFLYSCGFDSSLLIKRIDLLQQQVNLNSQRITENSTRIDSIEQKIEKIKERLAKEREQNNFLAQIPPVTVIDNGTQGSSVNQVSMNNSSVKDQASKVDKAKNKKDSRIVSEHVVKKPVVENSKPNEDLDPRDLYKKALSLYFSARYDEASNLFKEFLDNFDKTNPLYDNAMFWLAYCYLHEGRTQEAVDLFKRIINEFPYESVENGGKTDAAIYALIKIYKKERDKDQINKYRLLLLKRFPKSRYAAYLKRRKKG